MSRFSGLFTALVTPFRGCEVDFDSLRKLIRMQLDGGVQGFVVNGTTAESPTLKEDERWSVLAFVQSEVSRQVPVVMGTGTFSTSVTVEQTQKAEKAGVEGALVVVPYYNKPPQAGLLEHFNEVARNTALPLLLYNVPGRTVAGLTVDSVAKLSSVNNIVGIKEATGDLEFDREVLARVPREFVVTSGDDLTFLELAKMGGQGVISVLSHLIPSECRRLLDRARSGESVSEEFKKYVKLTQLLFKEANPIPVKYALKAMGILAADDVRLPLVRTSSVLQTELSAELKRLDLI